MDTDDRFSLSEAEEVTNVPRGSLVGWLNRKLLRPARPGHGHGSRRLFSLRDLVWISIVGRLTSLGVRAEQAARFADEVVGTLLLGQSRWVAFIPAERGFEFAAVQSAADLAVVVEPFGRPGPDAAILIDGNRIVSNVKTAAGRLLEGSPE